MQPKIKEHICPNCNGTGFPAVVQSVKPGYKIFPAKCETCDGKGRVTEDN